MSTFGDQVFQRGGVPVGIPEVGPRSLRNKDIVYFVDANNGSDTNSGESWKSPKLTIQAAVTLANSAKHALDNVDIFVANGNYAEAVTVTRAGTALTSTAMLWENMGSNCGYIGTLRIIGNAGVIGAGHNKWTCGTASFEPCLYIGRPNVEVHGFNFQENSSETTTAGLWSTTTESGGHSQIGMPAIHVQDQYNNTTLLNGAGNNVLIKNCRINSGAVGVLNSGAKWVHVIDCHIEYCTNGVAMIGNSKGRASESLVKGCAFSANTYDILHGYAVTCWVDNCRFVSELSTYHLYPLAAHAASTYCTMSNCCGETEDKFTGGDAAKNSGWNGMNINIIEKGYTSGSANMAAAANFVP